MTKIIVQKPNQHYSLFILRLSYPLRFWALFFKIVSQIKFFTFYKKLLVPVLNGFVLLRFTGIHYLWVTRISYIVNILLHILSSFPHANKIHKIYTIYTLFSLNIIFYYVFSLTESNFLGRELSQAFLISYLVLKHSAGAQENVNKWLLINWRLPFQATHFYDLKLAPNYWEE